MLAFTEAWERFSYYGVRALFILFLTGPIESGGMNWSPKESLQLLAWFVALVYVLPVAGGWLGDRFVGQRRSVNVGAILLIFGYVLLAMSAWSQWYSADFSNGVDVETASLSATIASILSGLGPQLVMFVALVLIAFGTGLFKPNITVLVGSLYDKGDPARETGFLVFYLFMNIGVIFCGLVIGTLGEVYAWHYGFIAAAVSMVLSMLIFSTSRTGFALNIQSHIADRKAGKEKGTNLNSAERAGVLAIAMLGIFATLFWIGLEQTAGLLNLFAFENTDRNILGFQIPATWFQSLNPLFVIVLAPLLAVLWRFLAARGANPRIEWKFVIGLVAMACAFALMSNAARASGDESLASPAWLLAAYLLLTISELCIWTISLAAVTRLSPARHAGLIVGLWYLAIAMGGWGAGQIGAFVGEMSIDAVFALLSKLFIAGAGLLAIASPIISRLVRRAHSAETLVRPNM